MPRLARLHVAVEEHLTNIITHGYEPGEVGAILVRFGLEPRGLCVEIEDNARPFNPLEAAQVDLSLPLDKRPIGGLGVHLIRNGVDHLSYLRKGEWNVLVMITQASSGRNAL